jgi:heme-degrading monooxygenase HmoA
MVITIFRSRLREGHLAEYQEVATRMAALARTMPGFRSIKTFTADDGERVSLIEFERLEDAEAFGKHPEHREVQRLGVERLYTEFHLATCEPIRQLSFPPTPAS